MLSPVGRPDAVMLAILVALAGLASGLRLEEVAASALAVFVAVFLLAERRPPFGATRIPPASVIAAWAAAAALSTVIAMAATSWAFALFALAAGASAEVLRRRRCAARRRGLV